MYVKKRKLELLRRMRMNKNRTIKKKLVAGMLATIMACSSVATDGFGTTVHEMVKATTITTADGFVIEDGVVTGYTGTATDVTIPSGVTEIGGSVFKNTPWLTEQITNSQNANQNGLVWINGTLIDGTAAVGKVSLPSEVHTIAQNAFSDSSITGIEITSKITSIGAWALKGCTQLTNIAIPNSVTCLESATFDGCTNLVSVSLPDSLTYLGASAFDGCSKLKTITIPSGVKTIEYDTFKDCTSLTDVILSEGVEKIEVWAFEGCTSLETVTLPVSVKTIETDAFKDATQVTIKGYSGSVAQTYAQNNNLSFKSIGTVATPTPVPTATPTVKPTATPTLTPTITPTPTIAPTATATVTPTVNQTATPTTAPIETSQPTISTTEIPTTAPTPTAAPTATPVSSSAPVNEEETLKDGQYYVYFECDGGVAATNKIIVTCGTTYGVLPTPSKIGYSFLGWYTDRTDGEKISTDTIVNLTSNQTLYARWKQQSYNVNFDANGGTADTGNKTVAFGDVYGTLPIPQKENEIFLGWYTQKEDGNLITERSIVSTASNHTLYAHWGGNEKKVNFESLAHSFANSYEAFADEEQYQIPLERYQYIWGDTIFAKKMYDRTGSSTLEEWNGNSFGMAAMSVLLYMGDAELTIKDFNSEANQIKDLTLTDMSRKFQMTLEELIESIDTIKVDAVLQKNCQLTQNRLNDLCTAVKEVEEGKKAPVVLVMSGKQGSHAVVAYKIEGNKMFVYDPDFPAEERTIAVTQDSDGTYTTWSYKVKDAYNWGSADVNSSIGYIAYEDYKEVWSQRTQSSYNQKNLVTLSTQNAVIYNEKNEMVATITDGVLNSNQEEIFVLQNMSFQNTTKDMAFYLPVGTYTILNLDSNNGEFTADIVDVNQAATITTEASRVTFTIDDQKKMNRISCEVADGQKYQIVLESSLSDDNKNVKITGTGTVSGEAGICQSAGEVNIIDGNISSVTVDEQEKSICEISSGSSAGGTILLQGAQKASSVQKLLNGEKATYIMQPEEGYVLADVLVDGQSQGAVPVYTFENITTTHKIVAVFAKFDAEAITVDKIGTKTHTGKAITPAVTVRMGDVVLKENIDYKVEYSNNKNVGTATVKITGLGSYKQLKRTEKFTILAAKGESYTVGSMKYQVTNSSKKEVMFVAPVSKKKTSVTIPKTVKIGTATYKVTKIAAKAFKGCSKLKKITVKSTYLTSVGCQAFKGIAKNAVIKVPSAKLTKYKKLMKNKGQKKTVKITK